MKYTQLSADELAGEIADRAAEWWAGYGFAWYLASDGSMCPCLGEQESRGDVWYGLYPPTPLALRDETYTEWFYAHGSPELMLAVGTGANPWVASEALEKALRISEDAYLASLNSPPGSEARDELVSRMRAVLPTVIKSLRAAREKRAMASVGAII